MTIQAKYQNNDSGCFQHLQPGLPSNCVTLRMMIIVSDNTCTGTVVDMVGLDAINACPSPACEHDAPLRHPTGGDGWVPPSP